MKSKTRSNNELPVSLKQRSQTLSLYSQLCSKLLISHVFISESVLEHLKPPLKTGELVLFNQNLENELVGVLILINTVRLSRAMNNKGLYT
jgi:hypothetical protein